MATMVAKCGVVLERNASQLLLMNNSVSPIAFHMKTNRVIPS